MEEDQPMGMDKEQDQPVIMDKTAPLQESTYESIAIAFAVLGFAVGIAGSMMYGAYLIFLLFPVICSLPYVAFLRSDLGEDDDLAARLKKLRARVENKLRGGKREKSKYSDYAKEKLKGFRKQNEFGARKFIKP